MACSAWRLWHWSHQ